MTKTHMRINLFMNFFFDFSRNITYRVSPLVSLYLSLNICITAEMMTYWSATTMKCVCVLFFPNLRLKLIAFTAIIHYPFIPVLLRECVKFCMRLKNVNMGVSKLPYIGLCDISDINGSVCGDAHKNGFAIIWFIAELHIPPKRSSESLRFFFCVS